MPKFKRKASTLDDVKGFLKYIGEPALTIASSGAAEIAGGLASFDRGFVTSLDEKVDTIKDMQNKMTIMPTSPEGKAGLSDLSEGINSLTEMTGLNHLPGYWKDRVVPALQEALGDKVGSAAGAAGIGAASILGPKKATSIPRLDRADKMGYTDDAFHFSRPKKETADFDEFDPGEGIGTHVGTQDQARLRWEQTELDEINDEVLSREGVPLLDDMGPEYTKKNFPESWDDVVGEFANERTSYTMPLRIRKGNQLRLPDTTWEEATSVIDSIVNRSGKQLDDSTRKEFSDLSDVLDQAGGNRDQQQAIRDLLEKHNIDSIIYNNEVEVPENVLKHMERTSPTEILSEIKNWERHVRKLKAKAKPSRGDDKRIDFFEDEIRNSKELMRQSDSIIMLKGKDTKSKHAEFNNEDNLFSSIGGLMNAGSIA